MKGKEVSKKSGGITLIALVITIIVLLILAGVTIATLTGDNGLLSKASGAKNTSIEAEIEEEIRLAWNKVYMDSYLNSATDKANALKTELEKNGYTVEDVSVNGTKITITNYRGKNKVIDITTGTVEEKKDTSIGKLITKDRYGDYIDLGTSILSGKPADWRILYNDKNGKVYAILADYLPENKNTVISNAGLTPYGGIYTFDISGNLVNKLNDLNAWQSLIPEELRSKCQVTGAVAVEIIMSSYNEKHDKNYNYTDAPYFYNNDYSIDELYIANDTNGFGYWLGTSAPKNRQTDPEKAYCVRYGQIVKADTDSSKTIRPVVSIPSNLSVTNNDGVWSLAQQ